MPLQQTSGNVTSDAYGGGVAAEPNYIESVFSTYLYTGTGATQTITNGIDLSTKGGLLWIKSRSSGTQDNFLVDTVRGSNKWLSSNTTNAEDIYSLAVSSFNTTGFTLGTDSGGPITNGSGSTYASWTFRKQPKFFDVVTYTGNGASFQNINHSLGVDPAMVIVKRTDTSSAWPVYHSSLGVSEVVYLNTTAASTSNTTTWRGFNSIYFSVKTDASVNASGGTYVAYLFASDAGGFGLTGSDNVISCGSFTSDGSGNASVTLGYEPQFVMIKSSSDVGNWNMFDVMREMSYSNTRWLVANTSDAENSLGSRWMIPNATGFSATNGNLAISTTYIYIAIRRGPMKVPTSGTSVFATVARSGNSTSTALTSPNIVTDMAWIKQRTGYDNPIDATRLIGPTKILFQNSTNAEVTDAQSVTSFASNVGYTVGTGSRVNASGSTYANWVFKRAPSVFDVVCYTGTGSYQNINHNLTVAPELVIVKRRNSSTFGNWATQVPSLGLGSTLFLNTTDAVQTASNYWGDALPTATYLPVGSYTSVNTATYVAYLFATCAGVSKVGSYTGTGTLTTINCGFTGGARFVMIKRTDSTGEWYIWDTARGMVSGTDPSLMINQSEIEVNANSVYTASTGFQLLASPSVDINTNGGTYIFLAMA